MNNNWSELKKIGEQGEQAAINLLKRYSVSVEDVSDNSAYYDKDIDLLCVNRFGNSYSVEVKWDKRIAATGNMFIELFAGKNDGWFKKCEADYLFYGDSNNQCFYILEYKELRQYINDNISAFKQVSCPDYKDGKLLKYVSGLLVPVSSLMGQAFCRKIYIYGENNFQ